MSERYPGGIISKTPPTVTGPATSGPLAGEGGSASGVWTLADVLTNRKIGIWPTPVLPRALWVWGNNDSGQLGDGTVINRSSPVQVGALATWYAVSGVETHTLSIKTDGTLWGWGSNNYGQATGNGSRVNVSSPVQVGALTVWSQAGAGSGASAVIKSDGSLWTWGVNTSGQLGSGTVVDRSSPVQVGALLTWYNVNVGGSTMVATKTDGTLWAWGFNTRGAVGDGTVISRSSPVQVGSLTNWTTASISGFGNCAAIKTDGTLWAWGYNAQGQLGQNSLGNLSSPVQVGALTTWGKVSSGYVVAAIKTDGTLWAWGFNSSGSVGDGTVINRSSPVQVGSLTDWSLVSSTSGSVTATKKDGTLWAWGGNGVGQLGTNNVVSRSSPVQVGSLTKWSQVSGRAAIYNG